MHDTQTWQAELCLQFANTARWHASDRPSETVHSYADLVNWARDAGIVTAQEAERLIAAARDRPGAAADVLQRGLALREAIYRVVVAHIHERAPGADDLAWINRELAAALSHLQVAPGEDGYTWAWANDRADLGQVLWPIVRSAADLLTSADLLPRVGQCADDRGCGWLFLDLSKNRSRRWCDINDCGNRAKQRRHYQRVRGRQAG